MNAIPLIALMSSNTLQRAGNAAETMIGSWINQPVLFGLTWLAILLSLGVVALAIMAELLLRWAIRRQARSCQTAIDHPTVGTSHVLLRWLKDSLQAALRPLALLIWIYAIYSAFTLLLSQFSYREAVNWLLPILRWFRDLGQLAAIIWLIVRLSQVVQNHLQALAARTAGKWDDILAALVGTGLRLILPLLTLILFVPSLNFSAASYQILKNTFSLFLIGAVAFILYELVRASEQAILGQYQIGVPDNLEARKIYTQVKVLKRVAIVIIAIVTLASMLMVFDSVRQLGASILASAGIAGIIAGFAAQRSLASLFAGIQIAITQPIRLDDAVIVEGEWGQVEEITLTYVVVRIWDLRRLILPINYFIEKPFQNWTRISADLLGTVILYTDYTVPIAALRAELDRILEQSALWDHKAKGLQVTDAMEHTLQVRVLLSAADAGKAWDLRCEVREKLVEFLQAKYPQCLPRYRTELVSAPAESPSRSNGHGGQDRDYLLHRDIL